MTIRLSALFGLGILLACSRTATTVAHPELLPEPDWQRLELGVRSEAPAPRAAPPVVVADPDGVRDVVYTDPGALPQLLHAGVALPLRHTDVRAHLRGPVAEVLVRQRFVNDNAAILDAVYTFPLPENSAVTDMKMIVGARTIEAEIRERGQARAEYVAARDAGHTAALLEQERPNVFTQSLANIPPGETVEVELRYLQTLSYDAGEYEFVFPTVVGPRYLPGERLARGDLGTGTGADTDRVPDASRISPPLLGHGMRTGHDLSISVVAEAATPITDWIAPAHAVDADASDGRLRVALARRDEIPNRDFVLRYRSAAAQPAAKLFLGPGDKQGGHFLLVVDPPRLDVDDAVGRRELLFVVDVSGSMRGAPLALAKVAMREALARARPVDTFDVITFASGSARLFGAPRPANAENLRQAAEFVDGLGAGGGSEMLAAVSSALDGPVGAGRHRYVFLMTDGYIGEEDQLARSARALLERQRAAGRRARVFGVGIGEAPNSHLIASVARAGDGASLHVRGPADLARAGQVIERTIDAPVLTDITVDWGTLAPRDLSTSLPPDLLASHPLVVHGRYTGAAPDELRLRARIGERSVTFPIEVVASADAGRTLGRLWAREQIGALDLTRATATSADVEQQARRAILQLGLQHQLVTAYTSLIAVDRSRRVDGLAVEVVQPVEAVHGMDGRVVSDVAQVTKIRMDQARHVLLGGTSRDFTAVVDLAPTASRDAAGIRLGGSTGAEARYVLDGQNAQVSTFDRPAAPAMPDALGDPGRGFVAVEPYARARIGAVSGPGEAESDRLRALLRADAEPLAQCFLDAGRTTYRVHRKLVLVVHLTATGGLARMEVKGREPLGPALTACLRQRVWPRVRGVVGPGTTVEIDLGVWMRF
ncbi:Ca-activated chloride channel family protein [Nannocystis exedens]|uniref:Ca-activated chloride channel family protein n=1 Tax=Nannocystis exedens TaxID=54 RepID=A0A1I1WBA7_9BACT|nr:VIT and VWA domain-containing protein [Nannocystis exedens]PCC67589.1 Vault protein inter-alpha-trypsin [Nannocystis exedens]SFD92404.1 Ca-activated chloride channel family protein [Nannocystis exedens]